MVGEFVIRWHFDSKIRRSYVIFCYSLVANRTVQIKYAKIWNGNRCTCVANEKGSQLEVRVRDDFANDKVIRICSGKN